MHHGLAAKTNNTSARWQSFFYEPKLFLRKLIIFSLSFSQWTPLHFASSSYRGKDSIEVCRLLLQSKADVNAKAING